MMPERMLGDYGLNCSTAKAQAPAQVGLAYKNNGMIDHISVKHICRVSFYRNFILSVELLFNLFRSAKCSIPYIQGSHLS